MEGLPRAEAVLLAAVVLLRAYAMRRYAEVEVTDNAGQEGLAGVLREVVTLIGARWWRSSRRRGELMAAKGKERRAQRGAGKTKGVETERLVRETGTAHRRRASTRAPGETGGEWQCSPPA